MLWRATGAGQMPVEIYASRSLNTIDDPPKEYVLDNLQLVCSLCWTMEILNRREQARVFFSDTLHSPARSLAGVRGLAVQ